MLSVMKHFYRPQRSRAKVMFLQASVILLTGGVCLSACWDATTLPGADTPQSRHPPGADPPEQTPGSRHPPPRADTPWEQSPRSRCPPRSRPPWSRHPPRSSLRHTVNERLVRILLECILVLKLRCVTADFAHTQNA